MQHLWYCTPDATVTVVDNEVGQPPPLPIQPAAAVENVRPIIAEKFYWGERKGSEAESEISNIYDKIVYWRRNLFMLPNGATGKAYIREVTRLMNV